MDHFISIKVLYLGLTSFFWNLKLDTSGMGRGTAIRSRVAEGAGAGAGAGAGVVGG